MKGDFSRQSFNKAKHYNSVMLQQGRVQLDADWNEQQAINRHRIETENIDVIGPSGAPEVDPGFRITAQSGELQIGKGRFYLDGILCENDTDGLLFSKQPDVLPINGDLFGSERLDSDLNSLTIGSLYLVYLDVWDRHITALEDGQIREPALGGPDTATRTKTVWQARLLKVADPGDGVVKPDTAFPEWDKLLDANLIHTSNVGLLNVRSQPVEQSPDPLCILPANAGYQRLENQLYRVEVHKGGDRTQARFKWSRDNGTVVSAIEADDNGVVVRGSEIVASEIGKDGVLTFASDPLPEWVELSDDRYELLHQHGMLAKVQQVDPATRKITLVGGTLPVLDKDAHPLVRRWDQTGLAASAGGVAMTGGWQALEDGVEVKFADGIYRQGDFWLIPARTAVGSDPGSIEWPNDGTDSIPQPPHGAQHHLARLAIVRYQDGSFTPLDGGDCRVQFPPLTAIKASDVSFDDSSCSLGQVNTVQEAIDRLCSSRDLRYHNKHLHGWGIVCGLQVVCGPDNQGAKREHVTVADGYAIDCEGNDLILQKRLTINLMERIQEYDNAQQNDDQKILHKGTGKASLFLQMDESSTLGVAIEKYSPDNNMQSILAGTLWMDFYNDCIKANLEKLKDYLTPTPGESKFPISPTRKRLMTIFNLAVQLSDQVDGAHVYLSPREDEILRSLYWFIRGLLQSEVYCAMFDGDRQFPDYPFKPSEKTLIDTVFGENLHTRIRLHPGEKVAYTMGVGNKINLYDLAQAELIAEIEAPGGAGLQVRDIAISASGTQLYAIGTLNNKDTVFARADIADQTLNWLPVNTICDVVLETMLTAPALSKNVYAIGLDKGLYIFNPENIPADLQPSVAFHAYGHLVIREDMKLAFATACASTAQLNNSVPYDRVERIDLSLSNHSTEISFNGQSGNDDIALVTSQNNLFLCVAVNMPAPAGVKGIWVAEVSKETPRVLSVIPTNENTPIHLLSADDSLHLVIAYEGRNELGLLNVPKSVLEYGGATVFRLPVQVGPVSMASAKEPQNIYVLNKVSNTLTVIPKTLLSAEEKPDVQVPGSPQYLSALYQYRAQAIEAYADLLGGAAQYLKDCFFYHFLINCPECHGDEKIYLASVFISGDQVNQICNYSRRKYVKSFPTVEYWFSVIPVIPLISRAFEEAACFVLPDLFGKYHAPQETNGKTYVKGNDMYTAVNFVANTNLRQMLFTKLNQVVTARTFVGDWAKAQTSQPAATTSQAIYHSDVVGQPVEVATKQMAEAKINVTRVQQYDPAQGASNVMRFTQAPPVIQPGRNVTLYQENGVVRYYAVENDAVVIAQQASAVAETQKVAVADVQDLHNKVDLMQSTLANKGKQLSELQVQLDTQKTAVGDVQSLQSRVEQLQANLVEKDKLLSALQTQADTQKTAVAGVDSLRSQVEQLQSTVSDKDKQLNDLQVQVKTLSDRPAAGTGKIDQANKRIADLEKELESLRSFRLQVTEFMSKNPPTRLGGGGVIPK
jgi:hypothetical protein